MTTDNGPLANVTARQVLDWGKAQPADTVIGVCDAAEACLIAEYARAVHAINVSVYPQGLFDGTPPCYRLPDTHLYPLPNDLASLATSFDALNPDGACRYIAMHPADLDRLEGETNALPR